MANFAYMDKKVVSALLADPGADDKQIYLFKAPEAMLVESAYLQVSTAMNSGSAFTAALHVYDTAGTGLVGTAAVAIGGTANPVGADAPKAWTISAPNLEAGQWLVLDYQEEGSGWVANTTASVVVTLRPGQSV